MDHHTLQSPKLSTIKRNNSTQGTSLYTVAIPSPVVLLYQPPGLTFNNSTQCPHTAFICFAWISKQTAIISIQRLKTDFTAEPRCVYSAVRAGSLNKLQINFVFKVDRCSVLYIGLFFEQQPNFIASVGCWTDINTNNAHSTHSIIRLYSLSSVDFFSKS
jgi:hypothetical protein